MTPYDRIWGLEEPGDSLPYLLVCGSHTSCDMGYIWFVLDMYLFSYGEFVLIHGDAPSTDRAAEAWAKKRQLWSCSCPAAWQKEGRKAGPMRNAEMVEVYSPNLIIAFPGGRGTRNMCATAQKAGICVDTWGWSL